MVVDKVEFDYESSRTIKRKGFDKKVVIALSLVIVGLLMVSVTFIVLYLQETEANPSESLTDKPTTARTTTARPITAGPTTGPPTTGPTTTGPTTTGPTTTGPTTGPFTTGSPTTGPPTTGSPTTGPTTTGPTTGPFTTGSPTTGSPTTGPTTTGPTTTGPTTTGPTTGSFTTGSPTTGSPTTGPTTTGPTNGPTTTGPPTTGPTTGPTGPPECATDGCKQAAASLKRTMNISAEPCDDFYEFACGQWSEVEKIPEDSGSWNIFNILRRELSQTLLARLNVTQAEGVQLNATEKMQKYFQSCVNEEALNDDANIRLLMTHIQEIFPELSTFPWINMASAPTADQSFAAVARARKYGLTMGIFNNYVSSDFENPRQNIIYFDASPLGMERSLYLKENGTEISAYEKYLTDIFYLFAQKVRPGQLSLNDSNLFAKQIIDFEKQLARARLTPEELRNNASIAFNKMTLRQFADSYTNRMGVTAVQLVDYFKNTWNNSDIDDKLSEDTVINVDEIKYYEVLTTLLANLRSNQTEVEIPSRYLFANYLIWQIGRAYVGRLGDDFRNISRTFSSALSGISTPAPRWESCVNSISNEFPEAVGRLYVEQNFEKSTKERLQTMVTYLFDSFKNIVEQSDWMTNQTRLAAIEKANNFAVLIGYDDYIVEDSERLNREHEELSITDSYLQNGISRNAWAEKLEGLKLLNGSVPTTWITGPAVVNAFYAPSLNSISFPAGILQPPFLGKDYPDYWNFGAIGTVIGHEITHGFDDRGSQYGWNGSFTNWWDESSRSSFRRRADELVYQYGNYTLMGQALNGVLTQGENIADNGGMKEAFYGYKKFVEVERNGTAEGPLPGLNYSPEQMFFIANAQNWCSEFKPKALENQIRTGSHSPGQYRIIGPMQNFQEFADAFKCPVGSYMNPEKKNAVW